MTHTATVVDRDDPTFHATLEPCTPQAGAEWIEAKVAANPDRRLDVTVDQIGGQS